MLDPLGLNRVSWSAKFRGASSPETPGSYTSTPYRFVPIKIMTFRRPCVTHSNGKLLLFYNSWFRLLLLSAIIERKSFLMLSSSVNHLLPFATLSISCFLQFKSQMSPQSDSWTFIFSSREENQNKRIPNPEFVKPFGVCTFCKILNVTFGWELGLSEPISQIYYLFCDILDWAKRGSMHCV